jgi:RecA/RadA recombinase
MVQLKLRNKSAPQEKEYDETPDEDLDSDEDDSNENFESESEDSEVLGVEQKIESFDPEHLIPTGTTLLNCACSGFPMGGFKKGTLVNIIGDSFTGKTLLALTMLAEMTTMKKFDKYRLILDNTEAIMDFNLPLLFGKRLADRLETNVVSYTIESFYENFLRALKQKTPFVMVLDSFDALTSKAEVIRAQKSIKGKSTGTEGPDADMKVTGSYKTEKPKLASELFRVTTSDLKNVEALLIIISQTRDNIGNTFVPKTRSGGKALKFYSCHEMWLAHIGAIWMQRKWEIGANVAVRVSKNKLTGKKRRISFATYDEIGIDDIRANIEFLTEEKVWKKESAQTYKATGLTNDSGTIETLIRIVEQRHLQKELQLLVGDTWKKIESQVRNKIISSRRNKYEIPNT